MKPKIVGKPNTVELILNGIAFFIVILLIACIWLFALCWITVFPMVGMLYFCGLLK